MVSTYDNSVNSNNRNRIYSGFWDQVDRTPQVEKGHDITRFLLRQMLQQKQYVGGKFFCGFAHLYAADKAKPILSPARSNNCE